MCNTNAIVEPMIAVKLVEPHVTVLPIEHHHGHIVGDSCGKKNVMGEKVAHFDGFGELGKHYASPFPISACALREAHDFTDVDELRERYRLLAQHAASDLGRPVKPPRLAVLQRDGSFADLLQPVVLELDLVIELIGRSAGTARTSTTRRRSTSSTYRTARRSRPPSASAARPSSSRSA